MSGDIKIAPYSTPFRIEVNMHLSMVRPPKGLDFRITKQEQVQMFILNLPRPLLAESAKLMRENSKLTFETVLAWSF